MSHPEHEVFAVEVPVHDSEAMEKFQEVMNQHADETNNYIEKLADELGIDYFDAMNVWYLRGRSRWTQELEDRILKAAKAGISVRVTSGEEEEDLQTHGF